MATKAERSAAATQRAVQVAQERHRRLENQRVAQLEAQERQQRAAAEKVAQQRRSQFRSV